MSIENTVRMISLMMQAGLNGSGIRIPFMLMGDSGIGKTVGLQATCKAIEKKTEKPFVAEIYSAPQLQAEDIGGMPVPNKETRRTELWPLRVGDKVEQAIEAGGGGIIALDEFGSITNAQEAVSLNLLQGGVLGERTLSEAVALGAMGNPVDIAANGRELSGPAANRFAWFDWELPVSVWVDYMMGGVGFGAFIEILPEDWNKHINECKARIAGYIKRNAGALHKMPPPRKAGCAWPSPRSWENAAILSAMVQSVGQKKTSDLAALAVEACVGAESEFYIEWLVDMNMPDAEDLLADPDNAPKLFPERRDQLTVTMETLATVAMDTDGYSPEEAADRWERAWRVLGPVFTKMNDVGISAAKILAREGVPAGAKFPPEATMIRGILKDAGLFKE